MLKDIQDALLEKEKAVYELPEHVLNFGEPWRLKGDWMIIGDVHSPTTNWKFANFVEKIASKYLAEPRNLLIAGDLFNADVFSTFAPNIPQPSWAVERDATRALIKNWMKTFEKIYLIMGNHERRIQRFTLGAFDVADIMALIISNPDRVKMSVFSYCTIETPGGIWRVTHPKRYRQTPLTLAGDLSLIKRQNVISFHEHHFGITMDKSGTFVVINGGTLADHTKIPYMALADDVKPTNKTGFVMLKNGAPYLFGVSPFTDWSYWL